MSHILHIDRVCVRLDDVVVIDRPDLRAHVRVQRMADGAALVLAAHDATRDGAPMLGNLCVIAARAGAIVRTGGLRMIVSWSATSVRSRAGSGDTRRCRLCFGALVADEPIVACGCGEPFHDDCDRARIDCPACGAPRTEVA